MYISLFRSPIIDTRMDVIRLRKWKGKSQVPLQKPGMSAEIPVPTRCSSTVCTYWTDIDKMTTQDDASYSNTEEDPYLRALKQLSATHHPSLDDLPLDRPTASDTANPRPPPAAPAGNQAKNTGRTIGRRYHRRTDGGVDVEFVDVSAHQNHRHSTVSKVRSAVGVHPFHAALHRDDEPRQSFEMHRTAIAHPAFPKQEDREACRSRWLRWHTSSKMKERPWINNGLF
ncbi:hypothetical protein F5144DRAFT_25370 [Chaetomium tenue]|uniref:Uncharacterized protein n=1 Tax=Chaetomium tenue TaxID=1854479 RepID=A0ACB7PLX8_9PEZI|nr:hypothetical protein F5144DRAFT_25370 [Chaetomium globosum]